MISSVLEEACSLSLDHALTDTVHPFYFPNKEVFDSQLVPQMVDIVLPLWHQFCNRRDMASAVVPSLFAPIFTTQKQIQPDKVQACCAVLCTALRNLMVAALRQLASNYNVELDTTYALTEYMFVCDYARMQTFWNTTSADLRERYFTVTDDMSKSALFKQVSEGQYQWKNIAYVPLLDVLRRTPRDDALVKRVVFTCMSKFVADHPGPELKPKPMHTCGGCKRIEDYVGEFQRCSRCKQERYCGRECQKTAWRNGHKTECAVQAAGAADVS
eukprot:TRINITY_DN2243_c0_g2_i1.p1 TRINITY_DN2243_c0_g2~~TRINITY_DN2243_c0_g2_i1.p1  ORF type:complete len:272 (-),score=40.91 TRINITY_DN2243_c0_g2_i1:85-900(-)